MVNKGVENVSVGIHGGGGYECSGGARKAFRLVLDDSYTLLTTFDTSHVLRFLSFAVRVRCLDNSTFFTIAKHRFAIDFTLLFHFPSDQENDQK